ncbi:hypothetical protein P3X46_019742 [Hevea brasiliensis]|uniref:PGG domain-containing protein n=1 Tax=Hevea brasiliensis TaxID=3981 RepID=A0ABQ9LKW7_HEVBR|nr:hypothetical protein P3X46_019742 [Hevea brasiliensis]
MKMHNRLMEKKLYEAAVKGCVTSLLSFIHEDALVLDRFIARYFAETPLHIVSMLGHLEFAKEILNRKPQLVEEVDFQGQTPLHLATANGHLKV